MVQVVANISSNAQHEIIESLTRSLAETSIVTMKALNFHWNITGMAFGPLHALFQEIYEDHFEAQDKLAERIKALDAHAEGSYSEYLKRSRIEESEGHLSDKEMIGAMRTDQEQLSHSLRVLATIADKHGDMVTNDLAIQRADHHDKLAWILRAHLKG